MSISVEIQVLAYIAFLVIQYEIHLQKRESCCQLLYLSKVESNITVETTSGAE